MTTIEEEAPPRERKARRRSSGTKSFVEWVLVLAGALLVAFVVKTFLVQAFYIPSSSMVPALEIGDRVLVNKLSYRIGDVERGDVVVFERPEGDAGSPEIKDLIKRVVAVPGDTIEARDGDVFVNGERLDEDYLPAGTETTNLERQRIPADHYFVMGDNRGQSKDSRIFGPIDEDLIVGRAFVRVWPVSAFELL